MNKLIQEQLTKVTTTDIEFEDTTTHIFIPKTLKLTSGALKKNKVYRIRFEDFITNPNKSSTLASNWNFGKVPKYSEYFVEVIDKMANMIKLNGVAVEDSSENFYGWCPENGFEILGEE